MPESLVVRALSFSQRHIILVIAATVLITVFLGYFALQVKIRSDIESLIPEDEAMTRLIEKYGGEKEYADYLMLAVEADDPFQPESLAAFETAIQEIDNLPNVQAIIHPFTIIGFEKNGSKLNIVRAPEHAPDSVEEIDRFRAVLLSDPISSELLISEDQRVLSALFGTMTMENPRDDMSAFEEIAAGLEKYYSVHYTGVALATYRGTQYVTRDLPRLLGITALFILLVYYLGFRAFRAVILPILVVGIGTLWTVGFMALLGFNITVVSIAAPPLVLTLGSSYSIHILNQYYREGGGHGNSRDWIAAAVSNVNKTILLAASTTVIGFGSLLATATRQIREFGLSASFGIISCALLSLFFLPSMLSLLKPPTSKQATKVLEGAMYRVMKAVSGIVLRFPIPILTSVAALIVVFTFSVNRIEHQYDYFAYFPSKEKLIVDTKYMAQKLGGLQQLDITLSAPNGEKNYFLSKEILEKVDVFEEKLLSYPLVVSTISYTSYLKHLNQTMSGEYAVPKTRGLILLLQRYIKAISAAQSDTNSMINVMANEDFSQLTIGFRVYNLEEGHYIFEDELRSISEAVQHDITEILHPEIKAELWGNSLRYLNLAKTINRDQRISMLISILLIFATTAIAFRSISYGFCALFPLITGIIINFIAMALFHIPLDMTTVMVSSIAIGVGVDNSIHLLLQFRRQKALYPKDVEKTITNTLVITGRPIMITTASIVGGLLVLMFASFVPIAYFGVLVSITLFATALGSLVVLPVILSIAFKFSIRRSSRIT